jgi:hypothetical protein
MYCNMKGEISIYRKDVDVLTRNRRFRKQRYFYLILSGIVELRVSSHSSKFQLYRLNCFLTSIYCKIGSVANFHGK